MANRLKPPSITQRPEPFVAPLYLIFDGKTRLARFHNQKKIRKGYTHQLTECSKRIDARESLTILNFA
ncbi:hypothetical protein N5J71_20900 [Pseudomonas oleovorans]|nr:MULTISPECIES: hypothetical protein [Pseudomonas aeruginosa group]MDH2201643.1 hypothetical protein [Pseudomonas oleovorans]